MNKNRLLAACCLGILLLALLIRYEPAYYAADLSPRPDAMEYALGALSLYQHGVFSLAVNHVAYPLRYPYGFPMLIAPLFAIFGDQPQNATYANELIGVLLAGMTMIVAWRLFGSLAALIAGFTVAAAPAFVANSQIVMSDTTSALLVLLAAYFVMRWTTKSERRSDLFTAGILSGLGVAVAYSNIAALAALGVAVIVLQLHSPRLAVTSVLWLALGASLYVLPLLSTTTRRSAMR